MRQKSLQIRDFVNRQGQLRWRALWRLASWPVLFVAGTTVLVSAVTARWPVIDQLASRIFYGGNGIFLARDVAALRGLRDLGLGVTYIVVIGLLAVLIAKLVGHRLVEPVSWRVWGFLALGMGLGPGLIVNGLLKPIMNRPRPVETDIFGGELAFVPAWLRGSQGFGHHSFVSGEASAAAYLVAFAFVVPRPWRETVATLALLWAFVISLNRIAFGSHYLSDILIAWGLTLIVVLVLRIVLLADHDTGLGSWLA
jgi:lipid A 4'-phosphatase